MKYKPQNSVKEDTKDSHNAGDRRKKCSRFSFHRRSRKSASEEAPLMSEEIREDVLDSDDEQQELTGEPSPGPSKHSRGFGRTWKWLWKNRVAVSLAALILGGIIALLVYFFCFHEAAAPVPPTICLSAGCVQAAAGIIDRMSPKHKEIDPCNDFNQYVCGGFMENHDLRPDQGALFTSTLMSENAQQVLRHVLETPYSPEEEVLEVHSAVKEDIFGKLKSFYDACMDERHIKEEASAPLISTLKEVEKLFPSNHTSGLIQIDTATNGQKPLKPHTESPLTRTVAYLTSIDVTAFVALDVGADDRDPDTVVTSITAPRQPGLSSKEYYKDSAIVKKYESTIIQVLEGLIEEAKKAGTDSTDSTQIVLTRVAAVVKEVVAFESKLAAATPDEEDAEDVTKYYNPKTSDQVEKLSPEISIPSIVNDFAPAGCKPSRFIVGSPAYVEALSHTLRNTSHATIQAYVVWKTIQAYAYKVESEALKPLKRFNNELQGKDPDAVEERWRTCIRSADNSLGWILSKFFVEEAFSAEAKDFGDRIVSEIKAQFVKRLDQSEWMSKNVRDLGIQKVHNIIQKIGYPTKSPDIRNSSDLQDYYAQVNITNSSYFKNAISVAKFSIEREWSALCKPTDRAQWGMTADTVNAYYNPAGNEIVFPAGIMQSPVFYNPKLPQYLSYGAFGSVSGHELSHAFDSTGRHYDEIGNYTDWWDEDTVKAFSSKAQCFVDQYHGFTVKKPNGDSIHVNGKLTLGENIADAGGVNAAFAAWKEQEEKHPGQLLPGLQHLTKQQLFFISYASFWCGKIRPETAVNLIYRDPHSPAWARILGTMNNSPDFLEAFSCPRKEPVCELW